jgi:large subunit ribosomal protein L10
MVVEVNKVPLNLDDKKAIVAEVGVIASKSLSALAAHYRGLTVTQLNSLRANARKNSVYMRVVPNNLAHRALEDTEFACLQDELVGSSGFNVLSRRSGCCCTLGS